MTKPRRIHRGRFDLWRTEQIHAVCHKLRKIEVEDGGELTGRQEWLWDVLIAELEWRGRNPSRHPFTLCGCMLCVPPFPDEAHDHSSVPWHMVWAPEVLEATLELEIELWTDLVNYRKQPQFGVR